MLLFAQGILGRRGVFTGGMICALSSANLGSAVIVFLSDFPPPNFFLVALRAAIPLRIIFSLPQTSVVIEWESKTAFGCL